MTFKVIHIIICPINKLTDVIINGETYIKSSNAAAYVDSGVVAKLLESLQGLDKETLKAVLMARDSN